MPSRCLETPAIAYLAAFGFYDYITNLEAYGKFQHSVFGSNFYREVARTITRPAAQALHDCANL